MIPVPDASDGRSYTGVERTPDGRRLVVAREYEADPAAAWDCLVDTDRWPEWGPSVRAVECSDRRIGPGSEGRVRTPLGWVGFRVRSFDPDPPERRWTWSVARIPATGHRVSDRRGGCTVAFEVPLFAAGYAPVCTAALRRLGGLL